MIIYIEGPMYIEIYVQLELTFCFVSHLRNLTDQNLISVFEQYTLLHDNILDIFIRIIHNSMLV